MQRDITNRGHSKEKVINQIKKREVDYKKYIQPQKTNADIIINFYPKQEINYDKLEINPDIGLRVILNKDINCSNVINVLEKNEIFFNKTITEQGSTFDFPVFIPLKYNIPIHFKVDNFYDYVMLFALNSY